MICRICDEDINEKGQCNISPISGYPVCEDCRDYISCERCCDSYNLYYCEEDDELLCIECVVALAEKRGDIHTARTFYKQDGQRLCSGCDLTPLIEYLNDYHNMGLQKVRL